MKLRAKCEIGFLQDEIEEFGHNKFCSSCGAKMDLKEKNDE